MNDQRSLADQLDDLMDLAIDRGLYDAADWLARQAPDRFGEDVIDTYDPIHDWFGLTYASYLVVPRSILQSMSARWQQRLVVLLRELAALYGPYLSDSYMVQLRGKDGRFVEDAMADYQRGRRHVEPAK